MTKLRKNTVLTIGMVSLLILVVGYYAVNQSVLGGSLTGNGITNEVINENWNGNEVELQASIFGSATSSPSVKVSSNPSVWEHFDFCGDNDGSLNINNNYQISENIILTSGMSSSDKGCNQNNYITATISLPKGTLNINCNLEESGNNFGDSLSECGIVGGESIRVASEETQAISINENLKLILEEEDTVEIYLKTHASYGGSSASGTVTIDFKESTEDEIVIIIPEIIEETEELTEDEIIFENEIVDEIVDEVECNANIECQNLCGTKIPTCENNNCFCEGEQVFIEQRDSKIYFYLIPTSIFGLIALIVWMKRKNPRRKKK